MKVARIGTLLLTSALASSSLGQQKTYNWVQGNDETVRLDPGFYHTSPPYQPGPGARSMHVDIDAHQPGPWPAERLHRIFLLEPDGLDGPFPRPSL